MSVRGRTDLIQHDIKLSTSEPIRSKGYPVPFKARDVMDSEIKKMLELDVIEKSVSPYSSPRTVRYGSALISGNLTK